MPSSSTRARFSIHAGRHRIRSMTDTTIYPRQAELRLLEALDDSPAVLIQGPRQCGKTTLARIVGAERGYGYLTFDDEGARHAAESDPLGFAADLPERIILDEVQKVPALFEALKIEIDRRRIPGRFLLTGSAQVLLVPRLSESLAGRLQMLRLHPLAQCELEERTPDFLDALFAGSFAIEECARLGGELAERITGGGYPAALARPPGRRRANWYLDHADALIQRDVRDLSRIRQLEILPRLLAGASTQTARIFNASDLAAPFEASRPTIRDYLTLLERLFLLERLPAWHNNRLSRLVKRPKLHLGDTGMASALLGVDGPALAHDRALLGQLMETFVFQELQRQAGWHSARLAFHHLRDKDGIEVDLVIERGAGAVAGIEVKASGTVRTGDFRGLRTLKEALGDRFAGGVVVYDGEAILPFGDRLYAVPVSHMLGLAGRMGGS